MVAEDAAGYLGQSVDNLCYLGAEEILDVLDGVVGVFHHVVQQGGADGGGAQPYLVAGDARHGDGVHDVRLAGAPLDAAVGLVGEVERLGDDFHPAAMLGVEVVAEQLLECLLYHLLLGLLFLFQRTILCHIVCLLALGQRYGFIFRSASILFSEVHLFRRTIGENAVRLLLGVSIISNLKSQLVKWRCCYCSDGCLANCFT